MKLFRHKAIMILAAITILAATVTGCSEPVTPGTTDETPSNYPNSGLLISVTELKAKIDDAGLVIIDARAAADYDKGHIKNAISLPAGLLNDTVEIAGKADNSVLKGPAELSDIFGKNGVSNEASIVIYAAGGDYPAERVFWALEYLGHKKVQVLNGGYAKWTADGNTAVTEKTTKPATTFNYLADSRIIATKSYVLSSLNNANIAIVDSRNAVDWVVKKIPGSVNILMADYWNEDKTVKSFDELTAVLAAKDIAPGKTIITHCYVGYRSSQAYFVFRLMGYTVSNYDGSTTEWFADSTLPVQP